MRSEFLLGAIGLAIVVALLVGGSVAAGICHELLTPNVDFLYTVWLWLGLIPFWWLAARTLGPTQFEHPLATYVGLLPLMLLWGLLMDQLGPGNLWALLGMALLFGVYLVLFRYVTGWLANR